MWPVLKCVLAVPKMPWLDMNTAVQRPHGHLRNVKDKASGRTVEDQTQCHEQMGKVAGHADQSPQGTRVRIAPTQQTPSKPRVTWQATTRPSKELVLGVQKWVKNTAVPHFIKAWTYFYGKH